KNHNAAAAKYTYRAANVQRWINKPGESKKLTKKIIFLTFDDGPSSLTPKILDVLKAEKVPATFFVLGKEAPKNKSTLRRMIAEGHAVTIHSYSHNYNYLYPGR
ncbi:MAG: polysaccharide deacetylase, partial [Propionibacterium sp.]